MNHTSGKNQPHTVVLVGSFSKYDNMYDGMDLNFLSVSKTMEA